MRGIFRQSTSRYWWIQYAGVDGKLVRESSKSTRKVDADALLRQRKMEVDDGRNPHKQPVPDITLQDFSREYLSTKNGIQKSYDRTERTVKQILDNLGNIPMKNFTYRLVDDWKRKRLERGNKKATVNRYLAVVKNMFKVAMKRHKCSREVCYEVAGVELYKLDNARLRYLNTEEIDRLLDECSGHLYNIVFSAIHTGMRKGELLRLKWSNVDFQDNAIKLDASMTKDSEIRSIPMTEELQEMLRGIDRSPHIPWVFHDGNGIPFKDVKMSFIHALERVKIHDFTFHDLRHTFSSHFMMANHDIKALMEILGHASLRMTQRYAHIGDDHKRDEMMNFGERISGKEIQKRKMSKAGF